MTYKKYEKYKDSNEEWIGIVPETWQVEPIREFYDYRSEKVSDKVYEPLSVTKQGILPQLEHAAKTDNNDNRKKVKKGDFVINSRSDRKGSCGVSPYEGSVSLIYHVLNSKDSSINAYAHHLFRSVMFAEEFYKWGHGIVDDLWSTRWDEMKKIRIPMPPEEERIIIGNYLDKKVSNMDEQISMNNRLLELLEEKRVALINQVVTKGLNLEVPMKDTGVEWIGKIPEHWKVNKLKKYFYIHNGSTPKANDENWDGDICWITPADYKTTDVYINNSSRQITKTGLNSCGTTLVPKGSIIVSNRAPIGTVAIADVDLCTNQGCKSLTLKRMINTKFAYYSLSINEKELNRLGRGTTFMELSSYDLGTFQIPIPPDSEQKDIVNYLDKEALKINQTVSKIKGNIELLKEYKSSLIHHVVTGKIDVREEVV